MSSLICGEAKGSDSTSSHSADCDEISIVQWACPSGQQNFTAFRNHWGGVLPTAPAATPASRRAEPFSLPNAARASDHSRYAKRATVAALANPPFWYSFEYGMVHFVSLDTETDFASGVAAPEEKGGSAGLDDGPFGAPAQQIEFLKADLAAVDRTNTRA
jgi:hypothetical protein